MREGAADLARDHVDPQNRPTTVPVHNNNAMLQFHQTLNLLLELQM